MINQSNMLLGVNTYGLCKELTEDFAGTFNRLYEIGFQAIEALVAPEERQGDRPMNWWALETLMRAKQRVDELGMEIRTEISLGSVMYCSRDSHIGE